MSDKAELLSPQAADQVRAEQVDLLYVNGGFPLLATLTAGAVLCAVLVQQQVVRPAAAGAWLTVMVAQTVARWTLRAVYSRRPRAPAEWRLWANRYLAGVTVGGVTWGVGSLWLMAPGRFDLQLLVILVITACVYASLATFGSYVVTFYVFCLAALGPSLVWAALQNDLLHWVYVGLAVLWIPSLIVLARRYNQGLGRAITLSHAYAEQKAIAEQASLAKSRFLASASHDLRQPVHALGMFLGALRGHRLSPRSGEIIEHMDASIGALDGLFTSLLDISRLDAGVTETKPFAMPVQPLLARICREVEPEAAAKGIRLTLVATSAVIHSDPVLLERILRNIIGNAVRYTDEGRVLVGCRPRGERLSLEVWDTGRGIAPQHRDAVFEEFYQVANPDRDRAKGLGLGLAIVRRLAAMLDHPLSVHSELGRGSVFRVSAPRLAATAAISSPGEAAMAGLRTGLIVAIDDEAAVRKAMVELLEGWGHEVIAAPSGEAALATLAEHPKRPDLIICDYRLREGENGLDVIRRLQSEYNHDIPALLVTGDIAPERIREAEESGYPLLHKPLAYGRLRAAVQSLIASGGATRPEPAATE